MYHKKTDRRRFAGSVRIGLIVILLSLGAIPTAAEILHLEDPLSSHQQLLVERHRLTLGTEYFGADGWTGLRHAIRYEAARGEFVDWAITLPWLYSSWHRPGHGGRDNLQLGGSIRLFGPGHGYCRLATDFWLAFSDDDLYPLQQRRAFGRLSLNSDFPMGGLRMQTALAFRREMIGMGGEAEGVWPERWSVTTRLGRRGLELDGLFLKAGVSASPDDVTWWSYGLGFGMRFQNMWRLELIVDTTDSVRHERELFDYRISFRLSREVFKVSNEVGDDEEDDDAEDEEDLLPPIGIPDDGATGEDKQYSGDDDLEAQPESK